MNPDRMNPDRMNLDDFPGTLAVSVPGLAEHRSRELLPVASVGKLLLLVETAREVAAGTLDQAEPVDLLAEDHCAGSGLLTELSVRRWTIGDLALLTAAISDNTATNALLRRIGLDRVNAGAAELGLADTRILDQVREPRRPEHAPTFAVGRRTTWPGWFPDSSRTGRGRARCSTGWPPTPTAPWSRR